VSGSQRANLDVHVAYEEETNAIRLDISNRGSHTVSVGVMNAYRSRGMSSVLGPGDTDSKIWSLKATGGWYDLTITVENDPHFEYRLAGHMENGEDSISDPAMGGVV
jgi:phospholipase C